MISSVIGGAMLPHAPQFFTMPETEDRATVERVKAAAAEIGARLKAMAPDLWIIFSNDHAEQFFHRGGAALHRSMSATRRAARSPAASSAGRSRARSASNSSGRLYRQGFDPAFTSTAKIDYAIGHPAHPSRHRGPGSADLRQRLPAAAADDRALLRLWPGGGADRHRDGPEDGGRGQRRHVAFPRHRALFRARPRLGRGGRSPSSPRAI